MNRPLAAWQRWKKPLRIACHFTRIQINTADLYRRESSFVMVCRAGFRARFLSGQRMGRGDVIEPHFAVHMRHNLCQVG
jgi:hypothetical protein